MYYKKEYKKLAEQISKDLDKNIILSENRNKDSQYDLRLISKWFDHKPHVLYN